MDTLRTVLIVAAAIIVAAVAWAVLQFITAIVIKIVSFAVFLAVLYVIFLFVRSTIRRRGEAH